jgi:hypothetical protein
MDSASEGMHAPDESIAREVADERGGDLDPPGALEPAACSLVLLLFFSLLFSYFCLGQVVAVFSVS